MRTIGYCSSCRQVRTVEGQVPMSGGVLLGICDECAEAASVPRAFRKGQTVIGLGRGGRPWTPRPVGTVTAVRRGSVFVAWHGTCVEDEMDPQDLRPA